MTWPKRGKTQGLTRWLKSKFREGDVAPPDSGQRHISVGYLTEFTFCGDPRDETYGEDGR